MSVLTLVALVAAACMAGVVLTRALAPSTRPAAPWVLPAGLCLLFLAWSLAAVATEGPFGFWVEHTQHLWGVQIWMDLLIGIGVALIFVIPEARKAGMTPLPWVVLTLCTGSIGLLAMVARLFWLRSRAAQ